MHGVYCQSRTYPTRCPDCRTPVFFFSCRCGSKVFFEALGIPWPVHDCRPTAAGGPGTGSGPTFGLEPERASAIVRSFASDRGLDVPELSWERTPEIDPEYVERARRAVGRPAPIVRAVPSGPPRDLLGVVRAVVPALEPATRWGVRPGSLLERHLHHHVPAKVVQVTVHVGGLGETQIESYTVWIPAGAPGTGHVESDTVVTLTVRAVRLQGVEPFWLATSIEHVRGDP
jgi:hypothetical protein